MNKDNNIDGIFKNAAQQYSTPAPKSSWAGIDATLKMQRKALFVKQMSIAASVVVVTALTAFFVINISEPELNSFNTVANNNTEIALEPQAADIESADLLVSESSKKTIISHNDENTISNSNDRVETEVAIKNSDKLEETKVVATIASKNIDTENKVKLANNIDKKSNDEIAISKYSSNDVLISEPIDNNVIADKEIEKIDAIEDKSIISENIESNVVEGKVANKNSSTNFAEEKKSVTKSTSNIGTPIVKKDLLKENIKAEVSADEDNNSHTMLNEKVNDKTRQFEYLVGNGYFISLTNAKYNKPATPISNMAVAEDVHLDIGFGGAFDIGIKYDNFIFKTGVRRYDHKIQGNFTVNEFDYYNVDNINYGYSSLGIIALYNVNTSARISNPSSVIYIQDFDEYNIRLRYLDIPITIGYNFQVNNWSIIPHVGLNSTIILSNEVKMEKDDKIFMYGEVKDVKSFSMGYIVGGGLYYNLGKHWLLGLNTDFIYYPSSVSKNADYKYRPYSYLIGPRAEFRF